MFVQAIMTRYAIRTKTEAVASTSGRPTHDLRRLLARFDLLVFDAAADFDSAARIYRRCRAAGITPRGMIDCMIAAVAWRRGATLLSFDVDLDRVAQIVGIATDPASLHP